MRSLHLTHSQWGANECFLEGVTQLNWHLRKSIWLQCAGPENYGAGRDWHRSPCKVRAYLVLAKGGRCMVGSSLLQPWLGVAMLDDSCLFPLWLPQVK